MNNKEITSKDLVQKWKDFANYLNNKGIKNIDDYKSTLDVVDFLFCESMLDTLSNDNLICIDNLISEAINCCINENSYLEQSKLDDKQKACVMDNVRNIYEIFYNSNNSIIINAISLYKKNYNIVNDTLDKLKNNLKKLEEEYDNKFKELINRFTDKVDNDYLYSVYGTETRKASKNIKNNKIFFYILIVVMFCLELFMPIYTEYMGITINNDLVSLAIRIILTIPIMWAILFVLRSIKEDRKIEQAYKHKELLTIIYNNFHNKKNINLKVLNTFEQIAVESLRLNPALLLDKSTAEKIPMEELLMQIVSKNSEKSDDKQGQN